MGAIRISLPSAGHRVHIDFADVDLNELAELEHFLLGLRADHMSGGYSVPAAEFRRGAVDIARLLRRSRVEVEFDDAVTTLLRTQLEEIKARPRVAGDTAPLSEDETLARITASGRMRDLPNKRQLGNLGRLLALRHGANFSVPGAGKTMTLLALYEALRGDESVDRLLVVAPKNAFISWEDEIERCFKPGSRPTLARLTGGAAGVETALDGDPEIALITYQLVPNVRAQLAAWAGRHRTHLTLDESHRIKSGYSGVTATAALDLSDFAVRRDILSGTPLPHSPEDLRPQFEFLWPGQQILPDMQVMREPGGLALKSVEEAVAQLYVRTTKEQLELPELEVAPVGVALGPLQHELYELLRSEGARAASGMHRRDQRFFRMLGRHVVRLLQAAVNPMLLTQGALIERPDLAPLAESERAWDLLRELAAQEQPAKISVALQRTEQLISEGFKVLIWSQFVTNVRTLEKLLAHHGAVTLYGAIPTGDEDDPDTREGRIRSFHQDSATKVMIANPAAAGEGISLHRACHHAIYLDRSFNAAHYLQSVDRIHRLGLDPQVKPQVEILEAIGTVDARVNERLNSKLEAMKVILNDPGLAALAYDPSDVEEDFLGGIEAADVDPILEHLTAPRED